MRFLAKLILGFGILMVLGVGVTATDRMSNGAVLESLNAIASGESVNLAAALGNGSQKTKPLVGYLPEAHMGWKPEAWTTEIRHIMDMERIPSVGQGIEHAPEPEDDLPFGVVNLASVSSMPNAVVYRRGGEIVVISIHQKRGGLTGIVSDRIEASGIREPFARFGPATYVEQLGFLGEQEGLSRNFFARIGDTVDVTVEARARDGSIKSLLSKIDHAGILASLGIKPSTKPVAGTLPQVSTDTWDDPLAEAYAEGQMLDAMASENWVIRLSRWLKKSSEPEKEKGRVVIRRGGREGCETSRGGCSMATMRP